MVNRILPLFSMVSLLLLPGLANADQLHKINEKEKVIYAFKQARDHHIFGGSVLVEKGKSAETIRKITFVPLAEHRRPLQPGTHTWGLQIDFDDRLPGGAIIGTINPEVLSRHLSIRHIDKINDATSLVVKLLNSKGYFHLPVEIESLEYRHFYVVVIASHDHPSAGDPLALVSKDLKHCRLIYGR